MWSFSPEAVQWHLVDGEVIALDTARGEYLSVDGSGALLWSRLAGGATEESLAADLAAAYGIEPDAAAADVGLFLRELHDRRFLTAAA